jgi:transglutaminase-like putative cysteine protease
VKVHVWYVREPKETFQSPTFTVQTGAGDCDDHAILMNAIARNAQLDARIVPLRKPSGEVKHAVVQIRLRGAWAWAETTVDAALGEHPLDAVRRLGLGREDIA